MEGRAAAAAAAGSVGGAPVLGLERQGPRLHGAAAIKTVWLGDGLKKPQPAAEP